MTDPSTPNMYCQYHPVRRIGRFIRGFDARMALDGWEFDTSLGVGDAWPPEELADMMRQLFQIERLPTAQGGDQWPRWRPRR